MHQPAPGGEQGNMLGEVVTADHVQDRIDPVGLGPAGQRGGPVAAVVDGDFGAEVRGRRRISRPSRRWSRRGRQTPGPSGWPWCQCRWIPPCTRNRLPGKRRRGSNRLAHTVMTASGMAAASRIDTPLGTLMHWPSGTAQNSAYPPPPSRAQTASPTRQRELVPGPSSAICPDTSMPRMGEAPGGGG